MPFASFGWQQALDAVVSIVAAYLLALPLAFERKARGATHVGLRTVPLVSVGACGYLLITRWLHDAGLYDADGLARTLRGVMTGIGFIGGGAIVKQTPDAHGLATGAAVWSAGAIGASVAHGYYEIALVLGSANMLLLEVQRRFERRALRKLADPSAPSGS
jgi:putative Mg2+ transporter-C (MgtC) family protein